MTLSNSQIESFINDGFIGIPHAFSQELADECCEILWRDAGCQRDDRSTWMQPVVWLSYYSGTPFLAAANSAKLVRAFDQLVGQNQWIPPRGLGSFPIRFPHSQPSGDDGWHVDASFSPENNPDYLQWRINIFSRGRALLMLFLFSDVGPNDAPTRIAVGSHKQVARMLAPHGDEGLPFMQLAKDLPVFSDDSIALATGERGTVYLCHPFLAHAAQKHLGDHPRIIAQPALTPSSGALVDSGIKGYTSPVVVAIHDSLDSADY